MKEFHDYIEQDNFKAFSEIADTLLKKENELQSYEWITVVAGK